MIFAAPAGRYTKGRRTQETLIMELPTPTCIICDKVIEIEQVFDNQASDLVSHVGIIYGALICRTTGNYGSRVYDSMNSNEFLEFYVCDTCAIVKSDKITSVKYTESGDGKFEKIVKYSDDLEKWGIMEKVRNGTF